MVLLQQNCEGALPRLLPWQKITDKRNQGGCGNSGHCCESDTLWGFCHTHGFELVRCWLWEGCWFCDREASLNHVPCDWIHLGQAGSKTTCVLQVFLSSFIPFDYFLHASLGSKICIKPRLSARSSPIFALWLKTIWNCCYWCLFMGFFCFFGLFLTWTKVNSEVNVDTFKVAFGPKTHGIFGCVFLLRNSQYKILFAE